MAEIILNLRHFPEELRVALRQRALARRITLTQLVVEYVTKGLKEDGDV